MVDDSNKKTLEEGNRGGVMVDEGVVTVEGVITKVTIVRNQSSQEIVVICKNMSLNQDQNKRTTVNFRIL